jgi:hypothetical protein
MAVKQFVVRSGFIFMITVDSPTGSVDKVYTEGDIVQLEPEVGEAAHQLEYAKESDRADLLKREQAAATASAAVTRGIDINALAQALAAVLQTASAGTAIPQTSTGA